MTYSDFIDELVVSLYHYSETNGIKRYKISDLINLYGIKVRSMWSEVLMSDRDFADRVDISDEIAPPLNKRVKISAAGVRWVEDTAGENVVQFLEQHGLKNPEGSPSGARIEATVSAVVVPASDRIVSLDHNSAEHQEIADSLGSLAETVRGANDLGISPEERERLVQSLSAAQQLWDATELKIVQIKVGVIMAVEDAVGVLAKVGKAAGWSLLIETIKSYFKHRIGIDI